LTCLTEAFPGRVGASLLHAVDMPELITEDLGAYEALAHSLATDPQRMEGLRRRLANRRSTASLFDTAGFTGHIEAAYAAMWQRHQAGLAPDHISITPQAEPISAKT
jgi:predicted O-linked N-acetylglucosamine transferase (SPINDLY family)